MLAPGTIIGPYEVLAPLGGGGMGEVYRAVDGRLGRVVALKVLPASLVSDEDRLRRFEVEARAVAELSHPNILTIFEFGHEGDVAYAALELVEGTTLRTILGAGPLPVRKATDYARQLANGLAAAHARGVLHRDVKPDNVMVSPDGHLKLLDFGLARRVEAADERTVSLDGLTDPGRVLGTVGYMSPEQVRGGAVDERSDIFAVGVVLYEMLAGQPPFAGDGRADALAAVLRDDPPGLPDAVPVAVQRLVLRCLEKSPDARFQSATDFAYALDAIGQSGTMAVPSGRDRAGAWRFGWRRIAVIGTLVVVASGATAFGSWWRGWPFADPAPGGFTRVTYRRGTIFRARFAPGGQAIVYDAAFEGRALDVYDTALGSRDARPRGLAPAALLAVSPSGDLALAQAPLSPLIYMRPGRLAIAAASGTPRALADHVSAADWTPDGAELVVARQTDGQWQVEWPLGEVIHRSPNEIFELRVSPTGQQVAWLERPATEDTAVTVAARRGPATVIARAGATPGGLAWSPDGREVWFTATKSITLSDRVILAATPDGSTRTVLDVPGGLRLLDIAPDGRVLVSRPRETGELFVDVDGVTRTSGWQSSSSLKHLSDDGRFVLFSEDGPSGFDLFLRPTDGSPAVRLVSGVKWDQARLSPDATQVAFRDGDHVRIVPVGPGTPTTLTAAGHVAAWTPDGRHLLLWASDARHGRPAIVSVDGSAPERVLGDLRCADLPILAGSDPAAACRGNDGAVQVQPLNNGAFRQVMPDGPAGRLIGSSADGRRLYAIIAGAMPQSVLGVDGVTGHVSVVREIRVPEPTGVSRINPVNVTGDLRTVSYSLFRQLDDLYVLSALR